MTQEQALLQLKERLPRTFERVEGNPEALKRLYTRFTPRLMNNAPKWSDDVQSQFLQDFVAKDDDSEQPGYFDTIVQGLVPETWKAGINDSMAGHAYNILMDDSLVDQHNIDKDFRERLQSGDLNFLEKLSMGTAGFAADLFTAAIPMALGGAGAVAGGTALSIQTSKQLMKQAISHISSKIGKKAGGSISDDLIKEMVEKHVKSEFTKKGVGLSGKTGLSKELKNLGFTKDAFNKAKLQEKVLHSAGSFAVFDAQGDLLRQGSEVTDKTGKTGLDALAEVDYGQVAKSAGKGAILGTAIGALSHAGGKAQQAVESKLGKVGVKAGTFGAELGVLTAPQIAMGEMPTTEDLGILAGELMILKLSPKLWNAMRGNVARIKVGEKEVEKRDVKTGKVVKDKDGKPIMETQPVYEKQYLGAEVDIEALDRDIISLTKIEHISRKIKDIAKDSPEGVREILEGVTGESLANAKRDILRKQNEHLDSNTQDLINDFSNKKLTAKELFNKIKEGEYGDSSELQNQLGAFVLKADLLREKLNNDIGEKKLSKEEEINAKEIIQSIDLIESALGSRSEIDGSTTKNFDVLKDKYLDLKKNKKRIDKDKADKKKTEGMSEEDLKKAQEKAKFTEEEKERDKKETEKFEFNQEKVEDIAERMSKGEKNWTNDELEYQKKFSNEINEILERKKKPVDETEALLSKGNELVKRVGEDKSQELSKSIKELDTLSGLPKEDVKVELAEVKDRIQKQINDIKTKLAEDKDTQFEEIYKKRKAWFDKKIKRDSKDIDKLSDSDKGVIYDIAMNLPEVKRPKLVKFFSELLKTSKKNKLSDLTKEDATKFVQHLIDNINPKNKNQHLSSGQTDIITDMFRQLQKNGILKVDIRPDKLIKDQIELQNLESVKPKPAKMSIEETDVVLDKTIKELRKTGGEKEGKIADAIQLAKEYGVRDQEINKLLWKHLKKDVETEHHYIDLTGKAAKKKGQKRHLYIEKEFAEELNKRRGAETDFIFSHGKGATKKASVVSKPFLNKVGIDRLGKIKNQFVSKEKFKYGDKNVTDADISVMKHARGHSEKGAEPAYTKEASIGDVLKAQKKVRDKVKGLKTEGKGEGFEAGFLGITPKNIKMAYDGLISTGKFLFKDLPKHLQNQAKKLGINTQSFSEAMRKLADGTTKATGKMKQWMNDVLRSIKKWTKKQTWIAEGAEKLMEKTGGLKRFASTEGTGKKGTKLTKKPVSFYTSSIKRHENKIKNYQKELRLAEERNDPKAVESHKKSIKKWENLLDNFKKNIIPEELKSQVLGETKTPKKPVYKSETLGDVEVKDMGINHLQNALNKLKSKKNKDENDLQVIKQMEERLDPKKVSEPKLSKTKPVSEDGKISNKAKILSKIENERIKNAMPDKLYKDLLDAFEIKAEDLKNIPDNQLKEVLSAVRRYTKMTSPHLHSTIMDVVNSEFSHQFKGMKHTPQMLVDTYALLLRSVGSTLRGLGTHGAILADKVLNREVWEAHYEGMGEHALHNVTKLLGEGSMKKGEKKLHFLMQRDPALREMDMFDNPEAKEFLRRMGDDTLLSEGSGGIKYGNKYYKNKEYVANEILTDVFKKYWEEQYSIAKQWMNDTEYKKFVAEQEALREDNYITRLVTDEFRKLAEQGTETYSELIFEAIKLKRTNIKKVQEKRVSKLEEKRAKLEKERKDLISKPTKTSREETKIKKLFEDMKENVKEQEKLNKQYDKEYESFGNVDGKPSDKAWKYGTKQVDHMITPKFETLFHPNFQIERKPFKPGDRDFLYRKIDGKEVPIFNIDFGEVFRAYTKRTSRYLSTGQIFPEFTNMSGEASFGKQRRKAQEWLLEDKKLQLKTDTGAYARHVIHDSLFGTDDILTSKLNRKVRQFTGLSGALGLSSPFAGLKNTFLADVHNFTAYGPEAWVRSWMGILDKENWKRARKAGSLITSVEYQVEQGLHGETAGKYGKKLYTGLMKAGLMKPTEWANRVRAQVAGLFALEQDLKVLNGTKEGLIFKKMRRKDAQNRLDHVWKFSKEEQADIIKYGIDSSKIPTDIKNYKKVVDRVEFLRMKAEHMTHAATQGLTSKHFMPLYASHGMVKPFLLFYRMAYAAMENVNNSVIKPLGHGNAFPMMRWVAAGNLTGAAMWELYDFVLGVEKPAVNTQQELFSNMARAETLGLGGFIIDPYNDDGIAGAFQPVIWRNFTEIGTNIMGVLSGKKFVGQALDDVVSNTTTGWSHTKRAFNKVSNKYLTDYRKVKTLEKSYLKSVGEHRYLQEHSLNKRHPFYRDIRNAYMSGDTEKAAGRYWAAYHFIVNDLLKRGYMDGFSKEASEGRTNISRRRREALARKKAKKMLKSTINSYKPLNFSSKSLTGRDHRNRFFSILTENQKNMVKEIEDRHRTEYRLFLKEIRNQDRKYKYSKMF